MKPTKLTASLLSISLLACGLTASVQNPASAKEDRADQLLRQHGLVPIPTKNCGPGVVAIWRSLEKDQVCAVPNAQYPPGVYMLTSDFQIAPITAEKNSTGAGNRTGSASMPTGGNQTVTVNVANPTGYPSTPAAGYQTIPAGYPTAPAEYSPPTIVAPSVVSTINPSQPVSPVISAQINASLAARGLSLASCSANPGVVVMMDAYMACAHPTPVYPPGRYSLAFR